MKRGFTLVEILVAMSILGVITLIMAQVFMASNRAWTGGLRQVEMSMEGRAALNLIATELAQAMADDLLPVTITANSLNFYTATDPAADSRALKRVVYSRVSTGPGVYELRRQVFPLGVYAGYPAEVPPSDPSVGAIPLVGSVTQFEVSYPDGWSSGTQLPNWIDLRLTLEADSGQTAVGVMSFGPDGDETDDSEWITTWR